MAIRGMGLLLCGAALAAILASPSQAGPDYTAADIIAHFGNRAAPAAPAPAPAEQPAAGTRAVHFGATGYGAAAAAPAASGDERFNLMITFEYNSDRLTEGARRNLDEFAAAVNAPALRAARFMIAGHTDAAGSDVYNMALSERRAAAVAAYLIAAGVYRERLIARGFGETDPLGGQPDDPMNRRVEARLIE